MRRPPSAHRAEVARRSGPLSPVRLQLRRSQSDPARRAGSARPAGRDFGNPFDESLLVYGVRTNEDRWAAVQAIEVTWDLIRLRYITWEKPMPSVTITGGFPARCRGRHLRDGGQARYRHIRAVARLGYVPSGHGGRRRKERGQPSRTPALASAGPSRSWFPRARTARPTRSVRPSPRCHWRNAGSAGGRARP